jgi:hypothetical protein
MSPEASVSNPDTQAAQPPLLDDARCLDCGYLLRGLPNSICPECGRRFDPEDDKTFLTQGRWAPWWLRWSEPPPSWHVILVLLAAPLLLDATSMPFHGSTTTGLLHLAMCGWPIVLFIMPIDYLSRLAALLECRRRGTAPLSKPGHSRPRWQWYVTPICSLLLLSALSGWPLHVRFALSQTSLERAAEDFLAGRPPKTPMWVGLYRVEGIAAGDDGAVEIVTGWSLIDPVGFEYRPNDTNEKGRLAPGWYAVEW